MKIAVSFFDNKIIEAIGGGIYKISIKRDEEQEVLYIGESFGEDRTGPLSFTKR